MQRPVLLLVAGLLFAQPPINAPSGLTVQVDGRLIGTATTVNFVNANGIITACSMSSSTVMNCNSAIDTNVVLTRSMDQAGSNRVLNAQSGGSAGTYIAALSPPLTNYSIGQGLMLIPNVNCPANATVSIGGLGPIALKKVSAGVIVPVAANDCIATVPYWIRAHGNPVDAYIITPEL